MAFLRHSRDSLAFSALAFNRLLTFDFREGGVNPHHRELSGAWSEALASTSADQSRLLTCIEQIPHEDPRRDLLDGALQTIRAQYLSEHPACMQRAIDILGPRYVSAQAAAKFYDTKLGGGKELPEEFSASLLLSPCPIERNGNLIAETHSLVCVNPFRDSQEFSPQMIRSGLVRAGKVAEHSLTATFLEKYDAQLAIQGRLMSNWLLIYNRHLPHAAGKNEIEQIESFKACEWSKFRYGPVRTAEAYSASLLLENISGFDVLNSESARTFEKDEDGARFAVGPYCKAFEPSCNRKLGNAVFQKIAPEVRGGGRFAFMLARRSSGPLSFEL